MADGFIVRKGGVADATPPPTIKFVSKTDTSITFTITNNSLKARDITHGLTTPPTTTTINLAALATSSNQTISNLDNNEQYFIFAQAEDSAITEFRVTLGTLPVFTAATGGTTAEYNDGGKRFKSHTFTSNGNFVVSTAGNGDRNKVDYLIIAGGGSGGNVYAGGGGAGGFRTTVGTQGGLGTLGDKVTVTATTFGVVVGAGGTSINSGTSTAGNNGTNSSFDGVVSIAGGGGGSFKNPGTFPGLNGGSGGSGASGPTDGNRGTPGTGTANQGFDGGNGFRFSGNNLKGGGGGGAGEVGQITGTSSGDPAGNGGNGLANLLRTGTNETRAGGGGGGAFAVAFGTGGTGGGGSGGTSINDVDATSGTVNTGSGGGGASQNQTSGAGGSGIVVIRYEIATV